LFTRIVNNARPGPGLCSPSTIRARLAGDLDTYQLVHKDKLLAKEVKREGDARRYIVCHSFERAEVDSGQRQRRIGRALPRLEALKKSLASGRTTPESAQSSLAVSVKPSPP
jgi:hypothetical protein